MSNNRFAVLTNLNDCLDENGYRKPVLNKVKPQNPERLVLQKFKNNKSQTRKCKQPIPALIIKQREICKKYKYSYRVASNGNVYNNSTLYVTTGVAHPHQIEKLFEAAIERAKKMPEIFGNDFECDFQVNVVRKYTGEYMAYAFVDVTNPKLYYTMIGYNADGTDRALYIDDPNWVPPKNIPKPDENKSRNWCDMDDNDNINEIFIAPPKIRQELKPLIQLDEYEYDDQQREHLRTDETHGNVSVSPAFITPGVKEGYDDCNLYVSEVPAVDYDFLYAIFTRYARYENENGHYPKIEIRRCAQEKNNKTGIFAVVKYCHYYDTSFALAMLQKVRAKYNGEDITMPVRYAFKGRY